MEIVKCEQCGKHFDIETYEVCPNCGGGAAKNISQEKTGFGLFKRKKTKTESHTVTQRTGSAGHRTVSETRTDPYEPPKQVQVNTYGRTTKVKSGTVSLWDQKSGTQTGNSGGFSPEPVNNYPDNNGLSQDYDYGEEPAPAPKPEKQPYVEPAPEPAPKPAPEPAPSQQQNQQSRSLSQEIEGLSASSGEKTVSFFDATMSAKRAEKNAEVQTSENRVSEPISASGSANPVVGWLVCISGAHMGQSFVLHMGKNTIGRGDGNDVLLSGDNTVSRESQATIVYEPQRKDFFVVPRFDGNNLIYLNKDYIEGKSQLKDRDILDIGSSSLMFVRLCGDDFSWEEYI